MLYKPKSIALLIVVLALGAAVTPCGAQNDFVTVAWDPSPLTDVNGRTLPPALSYEVWVKEDRNPVYLAATVHATSMEFAVQSGISYRFSVRGVAGSGRVSDMSPQSKPYRAKKQRRSTLSDAKPVGAFPNPFNPMTRISCLVPEDLPAGAPVRLEIYDLRGQRVHRFPVEPTPGEVSFDWHATDSAGRPLPAGIYLVHFRAGSVLKTSKISLVK